MYNNCINECADPSNCHIFYALHDGVPGTVTYYYPYPTVPHLLVSYPYPSENENS